MELSSNYRENVKNKRKSGWFYLFLGMYFFFPSFLMVTFEQSSLAIGMLFVAILFHIFFIKYRVLNYRVIALCGLILLSALVAMFTSPEMKPLMSAVALVVILTATIKFIKYINEVDEKQGGNIITCLYYIFIVIGLLGVFVHIKIGSYALKNYPVFPFAEPSHFALAYAPIAFFYQMVNSNRLSLCFRSVLVTLVLGVIYPNLTLVIIGLIQFSLLPKKVSLPVIFIAALACSLYFLQSGNKGIDYFYYRVFFDYSNLNLSNLVYLQGWEAAWIALKETYGFGLGFQQNGTQSAGFFTNLILQVNKDELNRLDGGFLASKLISEAGLFGMIFIFILFAKIGKIFLIKSKYNYSLSTTLFFSLLLSILVELLFRGYGYFSPTFIMLVAYLLTDNQNLKKSRD